MTSDTTAAIFDDRVTHAQLRVLAALATYADGTTGECWPFVANVADRLGITPRMLTMHVAALCALGYVERVAQFDADGRQSRNLYRLRPEDTPSMAADHRGLQTFVEVGGALIEVRPVAR